MFGTPGRDDRPVFFLHFSGATRISIAVRSQVIRIDVALGVIGIVRITTTAQAPSLSPLFQPSFSVSGDEVAVPHLVGEQSDF